VRVRVRVVRVPRGRAQPPECVAKTARLWRAAIQY